MANPTTIKGVWSVILDTSGTAQSLTLDPDFQYKVFHTQVDGSASGDTAMVKLAFSTKANAAPTDPVADYSEQSNQIILNASIQEALLPRGIVTLKYISSSIPVIQIVQVAGQAELL